MQSVSIVSHCASPRRSLAQFVQVFDLIALNTPAAVELLNENPGPYWPYSVTDPFGEPLFDTWF